MREGTITVKDGRSVGFADLGTPDQTAVLWCHGGPGCRIEPEQVAASAREAGLRLIGIDRPGYGTSTPQPGRSIGGWVSDAIAVLDHLAIDRFVSVGISTGGAYALAASSHRVIASVAGCALTDMIWDEGKAMVPGTALVWNARDRAAALAMVTEQLGADGSRISIHTGDVPLPESQPGGEENGSCSDYPLMSSTRTNRFIIDDTVARLKAGELTPSLVQLWYLIPKLDPKPENHLSSARSH